ncbi:MULTISPECIES: relaxase/mobilization nuclease domain-containing protein, partial [unclassified Mucilaginibacter]|uniref:relaxase/mobilization nuclease domain-containing protein n=1 Tax=unclassified Mucilaginibacter TaxID=2617802 RepID=UPI002B22C5A2
MTDGVVKPGDIKFIYSDSEDLDYIKEKIGWDFKNTQYLIVKHKDKDHPHIHIVYNRVSN